MPGEAVAGGIVGVVDDGAVAVCLTGQAVEVVVLVADGAVVGNDLCPVTVGIVLVVVFT